MQCKGLSVSGEFSISAVCPVSTILLLYNVFLTYYHVMNIQQLWCPTTPAYSMIQCIVMTGGKITTHTPINQFIMSKAKIISENKKFGAILAEISLKIFVTNICMNFIMTLQKGIEGEKWCRVRTCILKLFTLNMIQRKQQRLKYRKTQQCSISS